MKIIFISLVYFYNGTYNMGTKEFTNMGDCIDYQVQMREYLDAEDLIKWWKLTCHLPTVNGDTGSISIQKY
jgi:hypothetical protein